MSRRALSYSNSKPSISPAKTSSKASQVKQTDTNFPSISPSSPNSQFISAFLSKLKEKYSNLSFALKKISDSYPTEIPVSQFKVLLKDLKLKFTEKEFQEFFKQYGKANKANSASSISLQSLAKCINPSLFKTVSPKIKKKISFIRTQSLSTRASTKTIEENVSSLNLTIPYQSTEQSPYIKPQDKEFFISTLLSIFHSPELVCDYFFINRDDFLTFEEFSDSVNILDPSNTKFNQRSVFNEFSLKSKVLHKKDFFQGFFLSACNDIDEISLLVNEFRTRLHQLFSSHVTAFHEIAGEKGYMNTKVLEEVGEKIGMELEREQILKMFSRYQSECKLRFKDFKLFWLDKEGICAVKTCEESVSQMFAYCPAHIKCLSNRGEEIFSKLQIILKHQQLSSLAQEILKGDKKKGFSVNGFELQKKDVQALKEFLKTHGFSKQRLIKSVKVRVS